VLPKIREGFIVDEDEEEEAEDSEGRERRKKKKRRRIEREEEEQLDEEDLDLIGEAIPEWERKSQTQVCLPARSHNDCID
jgi:transcription elongation factor SPT6